MQILVNTDNHVDGSAALTEKVEHDVNAALGRFGNHVTRVEAHLTVLNAARAGDHATRCTMEARIAGHQPVAVADDAATFEQAVSGATKKLQRALDHTLGRINDVAGRATVRTEAAAVEENPQIGSDAGN